MRRVAVVPTNRFRRLVVVPDVATNLPREISDGRKSASGEEIAFDLYKPDLDLVKRWGVTRHAAK